MVFKHHASTARRALAAALVAGALGAAAASGQSFVQVTGAAGLPATFAQVPAAFGHGVAAADYDNDGFVDIFLTTGPGSEHLLYRNQGDGTFAAVPSAVSGITTTSSARVAIFLDYDGDGLLDLLTAGDNRNNHGNASESGLRLWRQSSPGGFTEVTGSTAGNDTSGLFDPLSAYDNTEDGDHRGGITAGDVNNDGCLDIFVGIWGDGPSRLYINRSPGCADEASGGEPLFEDATTSSGVSTTVDHWQPVMHDFNGDGWQDIFVAVDFTPNHLFINQQDESFVDRAPSAGVNNSMNDMGVALGDYDKDGDFDVYITNIYIEDPSKHNILYRNDTVGSSMDFTDKSEELGVDHTDFGWGTTWLDGDNDGDVDLAVTNGFGATVDDSRYFRNDGPGSGNPEWLFTDCSTTADCSPDPCSSSVGFDDNFRGSALIAFDYDRDGDLDMGQITLTAPKLRLWENRLETLSPGCADTNYLVVRPRMAGLNSHAIGAVVKARVGSDTQMRLITASTSFMGQEPAEAHFGLGAATTVDEVIVEWPDGSETRVFDVAAGQVLDLPGAVLELDPAAVDFGNAATGSTTHAELMLSNKSALTGLDVTGMTLSDTTNFALDATGGAGRCGSETPTLAPLGSCTVQVSFTPSSDAFHAATLTVASTDLENPQQAVALAGCSALQDDKVVANDTIDGTESFDACSTITIGPAVEVTPDGRATFRARDGITVLEIEVAPGGEAALLNPGG